MQLIRFHAQHCHRKLFSTYTSRSTLASYKMEFYADNKTQWYENCTVGISEHDWASLNLIRSVAASFGVVIIICVLLLLVYSKSYSTLFQRLYLYLIIATLLNETVGVISIEHQWIYHRQELVCKIVGMFTGWTYVVLFIFSYEIIFYLLYRVVHVDDHGNSTVRDRT